MRRAADFLTFIGAIVIVVAIVALLSWLLSLLPEPLATVLVIVVLLYWAAQLVRIVRR